MSYGGTSTSKVPSLSAFVPGLTEGSLSTRPIGKQVVVTTALAPPTTAGILVDGTTYAAVGFIAPVNGCFIHSMWLSGTVAIAGGTNTFAADNYDASGNAARNVLSTTTIDPTGVTALEGLELPLSTTIANRMMDEGDVLNYTLVCGTMTTDGKGYAVTAVIVVPDVA